MAVLSTHMAAIPEIVRNNETGLIVPAGDTAAMSEALRRLAASPDLRMSLAERAMAHVNREYRRGEELRPTARPAQGSGRYCQDEGGWTGRTQPGRRREGPAALQHDRQYWRGRSLAETRKARGTRSTPAFTRCASAAAVRDDEPTLLAPAPESRSTFRRRGWVYSCSRSRCSNTKSSGRKSGEESANARPCLT